MRFPPIALLALSCLLAVPALAEEWTPEPLRYARIALDEADRSYFADVGETLEIRDFAPPAGPIGVAARREAISLTFTSADAAWIGDWHPTPRVQYVLVLKGEVEITVESGESRRFGSGSILLLEDVRGRGHDSRVVSETPALFAMVAVPETPSEP
ncbi:MAG: cupin domain-containing protein [Myxococcales bacterium]|nr:cupin domain-containing protein [Myxococcales bacterium]